MNLISRDSSSSWVFDTEGTDEVRSIPIFH